MTTPTLQSPTRRRNRRRLALAAALTLAALLAAPILLPSPLIRHYLAHCDFPNLHFRSATLNPFGAVTLYDVTLDDLADPAHPRLFSASSLHATFHWSDLSLEHFKNITLNNLNADLRPGVTASPALLRLFTSPTPPATSPSAASPTAAPPPLWFDQLLLTGTLHLDGYPTLQKAAQLPNTLPIQAVITMSGPAAAPAREFALTLGDPDNTRNLFFATARLRTRIPADKSTLLTIDALTLNNFAPGLVSPLAPRASLAALLSRPISSQIDRLQLAGTIAFAADTTLNLTADLRDLSAHAADPGLPLLLDHFSATTHIGGKWTATPLKDLTFSSAHCSFDALQFADWRLTRAVADLQSDASEITLNDLEATLGDAQLNATAAFDLSSLSLTRARLALNNISAANVVRRIPALQQLLPSTIDGTLTARLFLTESDADHLAAHLDVTCPDRLTLLAPAPQISPAPAAAASPPAPPAPPAMLPVAPAHPLAAIANLALGATVSWNGHLDSLPDITHGRLTADQFDRYPPDNQPLTQVTLARIQSDFSFTHGVARLDDFYADLPDDAQISAQAAFTLKTRTLDRATIKLNAVDAALFNPWLPPSLALSGRFDAQTQLSLSSSAATLYASLSNAPESTFHLAAGAVTVAGAPSPTLTVNASADRLHRQVTIDSLALHGLSSINVDSAMIAHLRSLLAPSPDGAGDQLLTRIRPGIILALNDLSLTGTLDASSPTPRFTGNLAIADMNANTASGATPPAGFDNLSLNATLDFPLSARQFATQLRITDSQINAHSITLNKTPITLRSSNFSLINARGSITDASFTFDGGEFSAGAAFTLASGLDQLRITFKSLDQQLLTQSLCPDAFTAEGPVSGTLTLRRTPAGTSAPAGIPYTGDLLLSSDSPGKLKIAPDASRSIFLPAAPTPATTPDNVSIPSNLDQTIIDQLPNYPYAIAHTQLHDTAHGLALQLDCTPTPHKTETPNGTSSNSNPPLHLTTTANTSIARILQHLLGFPQNPPPSK